MADARILKPEDADIEILRLDHNIHVNADGTSKEHIDMEALILKEGGREAVFGRPIFYNASASRFKLIEASSTLGDQTFHVDAKDVEDEAIASTGQGFDSMHQVKIAFKHGEIGARVHIHYEFDNFAPPLDGHFSTSLTFGDGNYLKSSTVTIESELPLHVGVNDPDHVLEIEKKTNEAQQPKFSMRVKLLRPVYIGAIDEPSIAVNPKLLPTVAVSSSADWAAIGNAMAGGWESVLKETLPGGFEDIVSKAKQKTGFAERLNIMTSLLAAKVQYVGDWRSVKGHFFPRPLSLINSTRFGDCKDFTAVLVAMARALGLEAYPALVARATNYFAPAISLPSLAAFNHAFVALRDSESKRWIFVDPTNFASFAPNIFPDVADRETLLLQDGKSELRHTPAVDANLFSYSIDMKANYQNAQQVNVKGSLRLSAGQALSYCGIDKFLAKEAVDYRIMESLDDITRISSYSITRPVLESRLAQPLDVSFVYAKKSDELESNAGSVLRIDSALASYFSLGNTSERISDLVVGPPFKANRKTVFEGLMPAGNKKVGCDIHSPWIDASRKIVATKSGFELIQTVHVKTTIISNKDLKSKTYQLTQDRLDKCFHRAAVVFNRK
jgi:hypothetical protein